MKKHECFGCADAGEYNVAADNEDDDGLWWCDECWDGLQVDVEDDKKNYPEDYE